MTSLVFQDFCSKICMDDYDTMVSNKPKPIIEDNCDVCSEKKTIEIQVLQASGVNRLCAGPCFAAFKFANNIVTGNFYCLFLLTDLTKRIAQTRVASARDSLMKTCQDDREFIIAMKCTTSAPRNA